MNNPIPTPTPVSRRVPRTIVGKICGAIARKIRSMAFKHDRKPSNQDRRISMFMVFRTSDVRSVKTLHELTTIMPVTVAATYDEALQAVEKFYYVDSFEHFRLWCELRGKDVGMNGDAWKEYKEGRQAGNGDTYSVVQIAYRVRDVATWINICRDR